MDFDETLFNATMDAAIAEGQRSNTVAGATTTTTTNTATTGNRNDGKIDTGNQKMHKQTFYPTPNSSNMQANPADKQFMSPFPTNYQNYPNVNAETNFAELDELLFTPMLSPAMTPMQQYQNRQPQAEVDWDNFDRSMFALTGSAIESMDPQAFNMAPEVAHPSKKQRTSTASSKTSRQTSPTTPFATGSSRGKSSLAHKRTNSMAAPLVRPPSDKESSLEASDEFSPVDLEHFGSSDGTTYQHTENSMSNPSQIQPITPSMLMSLQGHTDSQESAQSDLMIDTNNLHMSGISSQSTSIASTPILPAFPMMQPTTPRAQANISSNRDGRPRAIAPAHAKSMSVTSSPALGPQRSRPSPDIRPILPGGMSPQVGAMLASKSNYQHIVDGTYDQLNITYPQGMTHGLEVRRTSHKAAEQKRRDHLKECFELLRTILPDRPEPGASKVAILKKGYEHIQQLQALVKEKDAKIAHLLAVEEEDDQKQ